MNTPNSLPQPGTLPQREKSAIRFKIPMIAAIQTGRILWLFGALCALAFCSNQVQAAAGSTGQSGVQMIIDLRDGSRLVGKSLEDTLSFHSAVLGDLRLSWAGIRSIEYAGANTGTARLTATNGDVFAIQIAAEALRVETGFGQTELPVELIRSVKVSAVGNAGQWPSGLVARWTGDGNAQDSAGHVDGQVSGGLRYVPGPTGQAFQFNGGAAQVDFGNSAGNFGTNDFTVACWMKTDSSARIEAFLGKRATCDGAFSFWEVRIGPVECPPGTLGFWVAAGGNRPSYCLPSSHPMNDGQWHHIAWVRQSTSSGSIRYLIYVDGALDNSKASPEAVNLSNQAPLVMGQSVCQCCDGTRPYSGAAAELQIFSQALSAEAILTIYVEGKAGVPSSGR